MEKLIKENYSIRAIFVALFLGVAITVFALEYLGKIKHNEDKNDFIIAEYKGILLQPGESHRISRKENEQLAACQDGVLIIEANDGTDLKALIVDYKNRTVRCTL
jgi:hypothetical protein